MHAKYEDLIFSTYDYEKIKNFFLIKCLIKVISKYKGSHKVILNICLTLIDKLNF